MKTCKTTGFVVAIWAALMCVATWTAQAADGDICTIERYYSEGEGAESRTLSPDDALTRGQKVMFKFRLLNRTEEQTYTSNAVLGASGEWVNPWYKKYVGPGGPNEAAIAASNTPLQVGVWVSGKLKPAKVERFEIPDGTRYYTDMICSYTAEAGDFALPLKLAARVGSSAVEMGPWLLDNATSWSYYLYNTNVFNITEDWTSSKCNFYLRPSTVPLNYAVPSYDPANVDTALANAQIYIKTIDFDETYFDSNNNVWRQFAANSTQFAPSRPSLKIPGGVAEGNTTTLYLWVDNTNVAEMATGDYYDFTNPQTGETTKRRVCKITANPYDKEVVFDIKAKDAEGASATIYLAATPTNIYESSSLITNFITRTITIGPPPQPSLTVTINGKTLKETVAATTSYTNAVGTLSVELSAAYTADMVVTLTPSNVGEQSPYLFIGTSTEGSGGYEGNVQTITIPAGQLRPDTPLYVYAKRATSETASNGIVFTPTVEDAAAAAFLTGENKSIKLFIKNSKDVVEQNPIINTPYEGQSFDGIEGGVGKEFEIYISDAIGELENNGAYTVRWWNTTGGSYTDYTNLVPGVSGILMITNKYPSGGTFNSKFYVMNQDGWKSQDRTISVKVNAPKTITGVPVGNPNTDDPFRYKEGDTAEILFSLSEAFTQVESPNQGFIFLVPQDEASSNLVETTAFTRGIPIIPGQSNSAARATLVLKDGTEPAILNYTFMIRDKQDVTNGTEITSFASVPLTLTVDNVAPQVREISMGGWVHDVDGGLIGTKAAKGANKIFIAGTGDDGEPSDVDHDWSIDDVDASITDPAERAQAYSNKAMLAEWKFYDGGGVQTRYVYGPPEEQEVSYAFNNSGTNKVTVRFADKDMWNGIGDRTKKTKWGPTFTMLVATEDTPCVSLVPYHGSWQFQESDVGISLGRIDVKLNIPATETVSVKIEIEAESADGVVAPVLSKDHVEIPAGSTLGFFYFKELDGDAIYRITASVTNETVNADGTKWSEYYEAAEMGEGYELTVVNESPIIKGHATTNEVPAAINVPVTISWSADDVLADATNGMKAIWQVLGGYPETIAVTNATGKTVSGSYAVTFTSSGSKTVSLVLEDKDGGQDFRYYYFYVATSKALEITPHGPKDGAVSKFSQNYASAAGLGAGRVWAEASDGIRPTISEFVQRWTYEPELDKTTVYAYGYRVGESDNGALQPGKDFALDGAGRAVTNATEGTSYLTYNPDDGLDSFFYCWILNTPDEKGNYTGEHLGAIMPVTGTNATSTAGQSVGLPEYDQDAVSYPTRVVEAIFAKEYLPADNVGDINQDGIPDVYAASVAWNGSSGGGEGGSGSSLYELAGYTAESAGDLKNLAKFNGDGDYLPSKTSAGKGLIPNISSEWATYGAEFTARLELRGYGDGLNYRKDNRSQRGRNSAGAWISERDFSEAESNAWDTVYNFDPDWTPENRTDPTVDDTDEDGLPDGYEYYIWYHAYVGWMENGKLKRLEGSRFRLDDIANGEKISPADVADAFNPNSPATDVSERDTDNDGLTDLEEFAIGTNPVHWDTDGDGASDYWEVMRGLNPLVKEDDTTVPDTNPDKDYMAWAMVGRGKDYAVLTLPDGRMFAVADNGAGLVDSAGKIIEANANSVAAIQVYRYGSASYGDDDTTNNYWRAVVPTKRGSWVSHTKYGMKGNAWTAFAEYVCVDKPLDASVIDWGDDIAFSNVTVELDQTLALVHEQVRAQYGFDPRTAWYSTKEGYVSDRWNPAKNNLARGAGDAGLSVRTRPYTNLDEYLLLKYRYMTSGGQNPKLDRSIETDKKKLDSKDTTLGKIFKEGTTNPNIRYENKTYGDYGSVAASSEGAGTATLTEFTDKTHGADTDSDGVPDGWELYVSADPTVEVSKDTKIDDRDNLGLIQEFAGTDSCNVYSNAVSLVAETEAGSETEIATIYQNHPGNTSGWFNKFFPSDPWNGDTDGDTIDDLTEGGKWTGTYVFNRVLGTSGGRKHEFHFVYGSPEDDGSLCIRGGGMNPCSVDTDGDHLPDPWEMAYAGICAEGGELIDEDIKLMDRSLLDRLTTLLKRNDGLDGIATPDKNGVYITGGMDATFGKRVDKDYWGDAETFSNFKDPRTGTVRNFDFDQDGLQNYQEYLVQALRHLRYDDSETPLMGSWMPDGRTAASRKFLGFLPMNYMDGETFYAQAKDAGFVGSGAWHFRELGYFARPPHEWDPTALHNRDVRSRYDNAGYRIMLPPQGLGNWPTLSYASTDPRLWDSDYDNMDDFYELFHGLNPLLGSIAEPTNALGDVIARAYVKEIEEGDTKVYQAIAYWKNAWTGWPEMPQDWLSGDAAYRDIDAVKYPWMIGTPEADADGDGIRNGEEALVVNMTSPQPTHTDPTPLWLTDATALNKASFTAQYYMRDPELDLYWDWSYGGQTGDGSATDVLFAFESNEGYDTDGDWSADNDERQQTATPISDPLNFSDVDRRQPIWFPGTNAAAVSYSADYRRLNYAAYDLLRQFTVEAWIRPANLSRDQVILERAAVYGASTISNNMAKVRANFRLGIRADGYLYGLFDTDDAVDSGTNGGSAYVLGLQLARDTWTHVALTFNGAVLALYMDGSLVNSTSVALIPANGVINAVEEALPNVANFPVLNNGYKTVPCAVVLGAQARDVKAISLSAESDWASYANFYEGYLDEVRVWDGARKLEDIKTDMKSRYLFDQVLALRQNVYDWWANGATRNDNDGKANLPAELVMHFNFQTLPGATDSKYVAWEPSGFTKNVRNLGKVEDNNVPGDIYCGWWYALPIHSTVYSNYRLVPWIQNTVGHLPLMDGSSVDSPYWSESYGGMTVASEVGTEGIVFPNTANPYSSYTFLGDRFYHDFKLKQMVDQKLLGRSVRSKYEFELRTTIVGSSDLVPLGGAYARRCEEMWDENGAADAWALTGRDTNANGIPDWWEAVAIAQYGAPVGFDLNAEVSYDGRQMTAREAYLRDIQKGMVPTGTKTGSVNSTLANKADVDMDGIPDWWENLYGISAQNGLNDADNDQLSNYAEYLISEWFADYGFKRVNPLLPKSFSDELGQVVPDYFLRVGSLYLGEMFGDHDFMEDAWEDKFAPDQVSRFLFDAWNDPDEDGWSNFAECRAATDPTQVAHLGVDEMLQIDYPSPAVKATVCYNGEVPFGDLIIQAWRADDMDGRPDAVWEVIASDAGSGASSSETNSTPKTSRLLGVNPGTEAVLTLGPGAVVPGTVQLLFKDVAYQTVRYVSTYDDASNLVNEVVISRTLGDAAGATWVSAVRDRVQVGDHTKGDLVITTTSSILDAVGTIDYATGELKIDFSKLQEEVQYNRDNVKETYKTCNLANAYAKILWTSLLPQQSFPITFALTDPIEPWSVTEQVHPLARKSLGRLREGKNLFAVFLDADRNNRWTPGEPFGVATDVDVGWSTVSFKVELTDVASQMMRVNINDGVGLTDFAEANVLTDRGVNGSYASNKGILYLGSNTVNATEMRVRIVRSEFNGLAVKNGVYANQVVFDKIVNLNTHPYLTEADLLGTGKFDLDWDALKSSWIKFNGNNLTDLTNVTYRLVYGNGSIEATEGVINDNVFPVLFVNAYEKGTQQTVARPVAPIGGVTYAGRPTFTWTHVANDATGQRVKDYPAFQLRVWNSSTGTSDGNLVYDSGVQRAPARAADGSYSWTAPIYANMMTPKGKVFATTNNYWWSVSMLDAKFTVPRSDEARTLFRLETSGELGTISEYGAIKACVRYFGPATVSASSLAKLVRVQAFASPDFTGVPAGEAYVTNVADIASISSLTPNAVILGLKPGTYYVRAFVDTNGDGVWSNWETWGYANYVSAWDAALLSVRRGVSVGVSAADYVYTPRAVKVAVGEAVPEATIYMEDMDTDKDQLPDAWEMETEGMLNQRGAASGATFFTKVNPNLLATLPSRPVSVSGPAHALPALMSIVLDGADSAAVASAKMLLGAAGVDNSGTDTTVVRINSFSLTDGIELSVISDVTDASDSDLTIFTVVDTADVVVSLVASQTPDFANATEFAVKTVTIRANETENLSISADEVKAALDNAGLDATGFFKVKLSQR